MKAMIMSDLLIAKKYLRNSWASPSPWASS